MFECTKCGKQSRELLVVGLTLMGRLDDKFVFKPAHGAGTAVQQWLACPHCGHTLFSSLGELKEWVEEEVQHGSNQA